MRHQVKKIEKGTNSTSISTKKRKRKKERALVLTLHVISIVWVGRGTLDRRKIS